MGGCFTCLVDNNGAANGTTKDIERRHNSDSNLKTGINSGRDTEVDGQDHSTTGINKSDFKILKVIGRGSFGKVYLV